MLQLDQARWMREDAGDGWLHVESCEVLKVNLAVMP
jgi:hypothetical protein